MNFKSLFVAIWMVGFLSIASTALYSQTISQHFEGIQLPINVCGEIVIMTVDVHTLLQNGKVKHINTHGTGVTAAGDEYNFSLNFNAHNTINLNDGGTHCTALQTNIIGLEQAPNIVTHQNFCFQLNDEGLVQINSNSFTNTQCE